MAPALVAVCTPEAQALLGAWQHHSAAATDRILAILAAAPHLEAAICMAHRSYWDGCTGIVALYSVGGKAWGTRPVRCSGGVRLVLSVVLLQDFFLPLTILSQLSVLIHFHRDWALLSDFRSSTLSGLMFPVFLTENHPSRYLM